MKLRIHGDSIRLRLTQEETAALGAGREVAYPLPIDGGPFTVWVRAGAAMSAHLEGTLMTVTVPADEARAWAESEREGLYGQSGAVRISIEKDYQCLHRPAAAQDAGAFPNPAKID